MCQICQGKGSLSAVADGKYYPDICLACLSELRGDVSFSSAAAGFDRRRQWEDYAQDTVQPWDAAGKPNVEFFRLYPESAKKQFSKAEIEELKRKI